MSLFYYTVPFLAVLTAIVFFHELGHFLVGRFFGVQIDAFSLGFGPELAHFVDRKGTRWRVALLPLGGYVKFHGDADGASMTHGKAIEAMAPEERAKTLFGQSVWKRAAIVIAGPLANFVLAIVIFTGLFFFSGRAVIAPQVGAVQPGSAAALAGFMPKDVITSVNGQPLESFEDMQRLVQTGDGGAMTFGILRANQPLTINAQPRRQTISTAFGPLKTNVLGVVADAAPGNVRMVRSGLLKAMQLGASETWFIVESTGVYMKGLIAGRESTDQMTGPIGLARVSGQVAQLGIAPLLNLAAILSISIGLLNLVPIPLLDGGFLLFFAFEAIRGRAIRERTMEVGFRIGLTVVAALTIFVAFNDISHIFMPKNAGPSPGAVEKGR